MTQEQKIKTIFFTVGATLPIIGLIILYFFT
jgi:hypothetical protein